MLVSIPLIFNVALKTQILKSIEEYNFLHQGIFTLKSHVNETTPLQSCYLVEQTELSLDAIS